MTETSWIDTIAVLAVVLFGGFVLYRGLKEPIDQFAGFIKRLFLAGVEKISSSRSGGSGSSTISYG